jgi:hypothetical protein
MSSLLSEGAASSNILLTAGLNKNEENQMNRKTHKKRRSTYRQPALGGKIRQKEHKMFISFPRKNGGPKARG